MIRPGVSFSILEIEIRRARGRVVRKMRVHAGDLSGVRAHAPRALARLDIAPDHGGHVALVAHEAGVEVGGFVRIGGFDVCRAAREGVFLLRLDEAAKEGHYVPGSGTW